MQRSIMEGVASIPLWAATNVSSKKAWKEQAALFWGLGIRIDYERIFNVDLPHHANVSGSRKRPHVPTFLLVLARRIIRCRCPSAAARPSFRQPLKRPAPAQFTTLLSIASHPKSKDHYDELQRGVALLHLRAEEKHCHLHVSLAWLLICMLILSRHRWYHVL
jgi:hypothetical protein